MSKNGDSEADRVYRSNIYESVCEAIQQVDAGNARLDENLVALLGENRFLEIQRAYNSTEVGQGFDRGMFVNIWNGLLKQYESQQGNNLKKVDISDEVFGESLNGSILTSKVLPVVLGGKFFEKGRLKDAQQYKDVNAARSTFEKLSIGAKDFIKSKLGFDPAKIFDKLKPAGKKKDPMYHVPHEGRVLNLIPAPFGVAKTLIGFTLFAPTGPIVSVALMTAPLIGVIYGLVKAKGFLGDTFDASPNNLFNNAAPNISMEKGLVGHGAHNISLLKDRVGTLTNHELQVLNALHEDSVGAGKESKLSFDFGKSNGIPKKSAVEKLEETRNKPPSRSNLVK